MIQADDYPELHESRFPETKRRLRELFIGQRMGTLAYVVPIQNLEKKDLPKPSVDVPIDRLRVDDKWEDMLAFRLNSQQKRLWGHDWGMPMLNPNFHGYGVESVAYGSVYTANPCGTTPVCDTLDDIDRLPDVTMENEPFKHALDFLQYINNNVSGKLPTVMFQMNGPISAVGLIVKQEEILVATVEQPEKLKEFLSLMTDQYIAFIKSQIRLVPNITLQAAAFDTWWPLDCGILCEDDTMMSLSPKAFVEFMVPCYNRISDAFGGIGLHSCGDPSHLFTVMRDNIKNLRALWINSGEYPFEKAAEVFKGTNTVITTRLSLQTKRGYANRTEFIKDMLRMKPDDLSLLLCAQLENSPQIWADKSGLEENENIRAYEIMSVFERYNQYSVV